MCGICGWFGNNDPAGVRRMLEAVDHRGPDGSRTWSDGEHSLGAARLEIVGGSSAVQPWVDKGSGAAIVFNGEIYNFRELRKGLESQGCRFATVGEAEVLLNLYLKYGDDFPSMLRGMFAVAVVDSRENRILLARDHLGVKPLYYAIKSGKLAFSSEIKGLLRSGALAPEMDMDALDGLMTFGYVYQQETTLFKGIRQVRPGTTVIFDGRDVRETIYYEVPPAGYSNGTSKNGAFQAAVERVHELLEEAICTQVNHGDQGKAFYLSGGVDSTYMAALAATNSNNPIVAYTLADEESSEDLLSARRVAEALGAEHREVSVDLTDLLKNIPDYIHHYEQIMAGGVFDIYGGVAFHILSGEIAKDHKVAFSGEGADELFGGYYWTYTHPLGFADRIRGRLADIGVNGSAETAVNDLFPQPEDASLYRKNLLDWLMRGGLSNYHLCSVDRSCGAFGFEIRPAYLDQKVADEVLKIPIQFKLGEDGRQTKLILKEAARPTFRKLGIESVLTRQKLGMPWAVRNLESQVLEWAEKNVSDRHLKNHPFKHFLFGKVDAVMFDLFQHIFMAQGGELENDFDMTEFFESGGHERLYS